MRSGFSRLDGPHGVVDGLSDICSLGFLKEFLETGGFGKVKDTFCLIVGLPDLSATCSFAFQFLLGNGELLVCITQEDESQERGLNIPRI